MPRKKRKTNEFFQEGERDDIEIPVSANALTRSILQYLADIKVKAWRNQTGALRAEGSGNARSRFVRFGEKGSADIFAIAPPDGKFIGIEVKAGKDKMSEAQVQWHLEVRAMGGVTIEARSIDDVISYFQDEKIGIGA